MDFEPTPEEKQANSDLQPGEWRLYCRECGYTHKPGVAIKPVCPDCGALMFVVSG